MLDTLSSTYFLSSQSEKQRDVDFLKSRGMSPEFLYKQKILPEGADVSDFVDEMQDVESRARTFGVHLRWFADDGNSMAYVAPKAEKNTINFNLKTLQYNTKHKHTLVHELTHLRQQSVTGDAYHPPGFEQLSQTGKNNIYKHAGLPEMAVRDILEGFVEGSTAKKEGVDKNCAYTYFQVPAVQKLDKMVMERTGVSLIACYVEMSEMSMKRFESAILETNNQIMAEEALMKKGINAVSEKQLKQVHAIAKNNATEGRIIEKLDDAWKNLRETPAPVVEVVGEVKERTVNILEHREAKEIPLENIFKEELVNTGTTYELKNKTADRVFGLVINPKTSENRVSPISAFSPGAGTN